MVLELSPCPGVIQAASRGTLAIPLEATLSDLPRLLKAYRFTARAAGHHRSFNLARAGVQAFLRDEVGKSHSLYTAATDVRSLRVERREGNPQSPDEARVIRDALGQHGTAWWSMCTSGMMPDELWGRKWRVGPNYIHIMGTKREARDRKVPRICTPTMPLLKQSTTFNHALTKATSGTVQPYDARRTFLHWMEEARITRTRRKMYAGHSVKDVTDLYERHEVAAYLESDTNLLREYLGEGLTMFPDISPDRERAKEA